MAFTKIDFKEMVWDEEQGKDVEVVVKSEYINGANVVSLEDSRDGKGDACCRIHLVGGRIIELSGTTAVALSSKF